MGVTDAGAGPNANLQRPAPPLGATLSIAEPTVACERDRIMARRQARFPRALA